MSAQVAAQPRPRRRGSGARMKAGTQHGDSDAILRVLRRLRRQPHLQPAAVREDGRGVVGRGAARGCASASSRSASRSTWCRCRSARRRSRAARSRRSCSARSPIASGSIDDICQMIRNSARAGIPSVKYNLTFIGVPRTGADAGPRRRALQHVRLCEAKQDPPLTIAGPVDADTYWERITYFLEARRARRRGIQGAARLPSAGSGHAERARAGAASRPCSGRSTA